MLTGEAAQRVMALLLQGGVPNRRQLVGLLGRNLVNAFTNRPERGQIYLNVGHTGLDDESLIAWIARHGLRAVHLIHDLIPIEAPEFCRPGEDERHMRRMAHALVSASGIIGNSQATLDSLCHFAGRHGLPRPAMVAAWLAGDTLPFDAPALQEKRPFFVVLGTIEGRKNHLLLLQLWKRLVERMGDDTPRLMLIGQRGWEAESTFAMLDRCPTLRDAVIERGRCDDDELAGLLKGARALLMPSFTEGFGMPVVEALRLGTPVIASDLSVFREIAGTIPTFIAAHDGVAWERAILDFCGASPERVRQVSAMSGYRAPSWSSHFATIEKWLENLSE